MNDDDFLKRHRRQPDPRFVTRLAARLNTQPSRSTPMFSRLTRAAVPALLIAAVAVAVVNINTNSSAGMAGLLHGRVLQLRFRL